MKAHLIFLGSFLLTSLTLPPAIEFVTTDLSFRTVVLRGVAVGIIAMVCWAISYPSLPEVPYEVKDGAALGILAGPIHSMASQSLLAAFGLLVFTVVGFIVGAIIVVIFIIATIIWCSRGYGDW